MPLMGNEEDVRLPKMVVNLEIVTVLLDQKCSNCFQMHVNRARRERKGK